MNIAGTGHRPDKLGGYGRIQLLKLIGVAEWWLDAHKPDMSYLGMAQGWDTALAQACCNLGLAWTACVPFKGQERMWPEPAQEYYRQLLEQATEVVIVCEGEYAAWKMNKRNMYMVDQLTQPEDMVVAMWDGTAGGTGNCVAYTKQQRKKLVNLYERWKNP